MATEERDQIIRPIAYQVYLEQKTGGIPESAKANWNAAVKRLERAEKKAANNSERLLRKYAFPLAPLTIVIALFIFFFFLVNDRGTQHAPPMQDASPFNANYSGTGAPATEPLSSGTLTRTFPTNWRYSNLPPATRPVQATRVEAAHFLWWHLERVWLLALLGVVVTATWTIVSLHATTSKDMLYGYAVPAVILAVMTTLSVAIWRNLPQWICNESIPSFVITWLPIFWWFLTGLVLNVAVCLRQTLEKASWFATALVFVAWFSAATLGTYGICYRPHTPLTDIIFLAPPTRESADNWTFWGDGLGWAGHAFLIVAFTTTLITPTKNASEFC